MGLNLWRGVLRSFSRIRL